MAFTIKQIKATLLFRAFPFFQPFQDARSQAAP